MVVGGRDVQRGRWQWNTGGPCGDGVWRISLSPKMKNINSAYCGIIEFVTFSGILRAEKLVEAKCERNGGE